jgi:hypothetical protein
MSKQTAVEWLIESLEKLEYNLEKGIISLDDYIINVKWVKEQSKAMEKEQIIDTFQDSRILSITNNCSSGEQYYNETFKQQEQ